MSKEKKFEENLADLEAIVQKLESGQVPLEEAISEFQKGMKLSKDLQETLNQAEKHICVRKISENALIFLPYVL